MMGQLFSMKASLAASWCLHCTSHTISSSSIKRVLHILPRTILPWLAPGLKGKLCCRLRTPCGWPTRAATDGWLACPGKAGAFCRRSVSVSVRKLTDLVTSSCIDSERATTHKTHIRCLRLGNHLIVVCLTGAVALGQRQILPTLAMHLQAR